MGQTATKPPQPARNDREHPPLLRALMMALIAAFLLPILLGGVAENEEMRREAFRQMRADHLRRIAAEQARLAERRARESATGPDRGDGAALPHPLEGRDGRGVRGVQ